MSAVRELCVAHIWVGFLEKHTVLSHDLANTDLVSSK